MIKVACNLHRRTASSLRHFALLTAIVAHLPQSASALNTWPEDGNTLAFFGAPAGPQPADPVSSFLDPVLSCNAEFGDFFGGQSFASCTLSSDRATVSCCREARFGECGITQFGCQHDTGTGITTVCSTFSSGDLFSRLGYSTGDGPSLRCEYDNGNVAGTCDLSRYSYALRAQLEDRIQALVCGSYDGECHALITGTYPTFRVGASYDRTPGDELFTCRADGELCSGHVRCDNGRPSGGFDLFLPVNGGNWRGGVGSEFGDGACRCSALLQRVTPCGNFLDLRLQYDTGTEQCSGVIGVGIAR